jgi:hypothetical protein
MPYHVSFYDESLKAQVEGSYTTDGKFIHAGSGELGFRSAPVADRGTFIDKAGNVKLAQKLLSDLAHDAAKNGHNGHGH